MKKLNYLFTGLLFGAIFTFAMCATNDESTDEKGDSSISNLEKKMDNLESGSDTAKTKELGKEYTAKYICPMHCEGSGAEKAGKCSVCEMDLIENPTVQKK
jgi:hypothetical protein